ncbi:hypothetical protein [Mucilaginibacter glaciei]|uniref:Uncharacterized protein n=1 Tax=Mucilaginibacter glaciei TaxID=2772109 RepID=A0A926NZ08_9SPHI|nr:hypothetical protein [Mucilaginibacter glaciei]MBD1394513.1 hypothetical protein [Mucilaginibacter glaciei]
METLTITSSSLLTTFSFLVIGSIIVFLILKFDKLQRRKMQIMMTGTKDVQPLFMQKAAVHKLTAIKSNSVSVENSQVRMKVAKQIDELVEGYDKGEIALPEYCSRLNRLLAQVA